MSNFKLKLVDINPLLCKEFELAFKELPNVEVICSDFRLVEFDCMVSAANSFGLMDGGVDKAIIEYFGVQLQQRIQDRIIQDYKGEQPVGTSFIIPASYYQYVVHTPTMRVPLDINNTDNIYLAMKAMLEAVERFNLKALEGSEIDVVACPGLGTLCEKVPFNIAAKQMYLAYKNFTNPPSAIDWYYANTRHQEVISSLL